MWCTLLTTVAAVMVSLVPAHAAPPCIGVADRVWYGPCPSSDDYQALFLSPEAWPTSRGATTVFQTFVQQLVKDPCTICGNAGNNFTNLAAAGAFKLLQHWGVQLAVEAGSMKPGDCTGSNGGTLGPAVQAVANVAEAGGTIWAFTMDEPLYSALQTCGMTMAAAASAGDVAAWVTALRAQSGYTGLVGVVEPYPTFSPTQLCTWIQTLHTTIPGGLPFFHLDIDFNAAVPSHVEADIAAIKGCGDSIGVSFGGIVNAFPVTTDAQYAALTLQHLATYQAAVGRLADVVFESWDVAPPVPSNIPETTPTTHAGIMCAALPGRAAATAAAAAEAPGSLSVAFTDLTTLLDGTPGLDFVDIVSPVETHPELVEAVAARGIPVICQKPMAPSYARAKEMVDFCTRKGVPLLVHENWRWQRPIRALHDVLQTGVIGVPFRGRIDMLSGFPVFDNQPFLKQLQQFIITDLGSHTLDVARLLFGEMTAVHCLTHKVHTDIRGEDVATITMQAASGAHVVVEMAYAGTPLERERFPETFIFVEGPLGSVELGPDFWLRVTTKGGTHLTRCVPPRYPWADPAYDVVHSSIVPCNENLLGALTGRGQAETTGADNLKTTRLVFAAYESAASGQVVRV